MSFENWHEVTLVFFMSLNVRFFRIGLHVFFFSFLYVELSHSYTHGHKVDVLARVNSNNSDLILFYFQFNWRHLFISNFILLFFSVYLLCSRFPQSSPHCHDHEFQKFTHVDFYHFSFFYNYFFFNFTSNIYFLRKRSLFFYFLLFFTFNFFVLLNILILFSYLLIKY
jgi:hypothetical protein